MQPCMCRGGMGMVCTFNGTQGAPLRCLGSLHDGASCLHPMAEQTSYMGAGAHLRCRG